MPFLARTLDNTDQYIFALVINPGFYVHHHIEVANYDPARPSISSPYNIIIIVVKHPIEN